MTTTFDYTKVPFGTESAAAVEAFIESALPAIEAEIRAAETRGDRLAGGVLLVADVDIGPSSSGAVDFMSLAAFKGLVAKMPSMPTEHRAIVARLDAPSPKGMVRVAAFFGGMIAATLVRRVKPPSFVEGPGGEYMLNAAAVLITMYRTPLEDLLPGAPRARMRRFQNMVDALVGREAMRPTARSAEQILTEDLAHLFENDMTTLGADAAFDRLFAKAELQAVPS